MSESSGPFSLGFKQSVALTAVLASLATTTAILSYQTIRREHRTERLKKQVGEEVDEWERTHEEEEASGSSTPENTEVVPKKQREWKKGEFDESLIREQVGVDSAKC